MNKNFNNKEIYNICSNNPIYIKNLIKYLKEYSNFTKVKNVNLNKFEVYKTHGKNNKINKFLNYKKYSKFYECVENKTMKNTNI